MSVVSHTTQYNVRMLAAVAATAMSTPPWWAIPTFTLAGGILGASVTQGFTIVNDRRKAAKDEQANNQTVARDATVRFLTAIHAAFISMRDTRRPYSSGDVNLTWAELQICADPQVVVSGREYMNALNAVAIYVREHASLTDQLRDNYDIARLAFMGTARSQHGLDPVPALTHVVRYTDMGA